ncbi:TEL2-interacting protein 1 [Golovinomyces cichoracearum]|uniref:TEL2-interacting protein 1 n=1 Tax=Golovinomyces cichoracearum TaxID=62708 RepID=A0A420HMK0_9PEZI|nr:TEL2-interacting protein 1 [Golovinomyces cichoracearum]
MENESSRSQRDALFKQLKPSCVALSQLTLVDDGDPSNVKAVIDGTAKLLHVLEDKCQRTDGSFDEKLADYVFFPLSQVLRKKQKFTDQLSEQTIKCVRILLEYGWRTSIDLELAKQLLILLSFVAGGKPGKEILLAPEELLIETLRALSALFYAVENTRGGPAAIKEPEIILALGYCLTVILEAITDGSTSSIQFQALFALERAWHCIRDPVTLSKFLPGAVSVLTKCSMLTTKTRRSRKVFVKTLDLLCYILVSCLSDIVTRNVRINQNNSQDKSAKESNKNTLMTEWLTTTSEQIKLALLKVVELRNHKAVEVQRALNNLCITLLDECHETLSDSSQILVETSLSLHGIDSDDRVGERKTDLSDLVLIYADLAEIIKVIIHDWVTNLPKIMQKNDETAKISALENLSHAQILLSSLNLKSSLLEEALLNSLRDSIRVNIDPLLPAKSLQETRVHIDSLAISALISKNPTSIKFDPIIMPRESQKNTREKFMTLVTNLGSGDSQMKLANKMLEYAECASGPSLLSSYWLSFEILKIVNRKNKEIEEFLVPSLTSCCNQASLEQSLFFFSFSLLSKDDEEINDWRLQAIALEVMAYVAQRMKHSFRTELVDTLYPVVQFLGSPNQILREHAITCLNIFSHSCGYSDSSALIINNVDYMVNAICLRLNTFNIAPQGPQILIMMIHLAGPTLLPYLDDVVDSIFAALANYHGYQHLVGAFFSVLAEIVSVGSKSDQLLINGVDDKSSPVSHRKKIFPIPTIESIIESYISPSTQSQKEGPDNFSDYQKFPAVPWKDSTKNFVHQNSDHIGQNDDIDKYNNDSEFKEVQKLPPSKLYSMLQSIARLSQYHLTSSSPVLRSKLLGLITKAAGALYHDEDNFLPLVNDIWPVVVKRIYDPESFVCIAACDTVTELCRCTGDFISTRISVEWSQLISIIRSIKTSVERERHTGHGRGSYSQASQKWDAFLRLLTAIVSYVRIEDEMLDGLIELLGTSVWETEEVKIAIESVNADIVWFAKYIHNNENWLPLE